MADEHTRSGARPASPFTNLADYNAVPRVGGLVLSPDGTRLVCSVQTLAPDGTSFQTSLWDVDPDGVRPARRLTRSAAGEAAPAFTPNGDLLFISKRPDSGPKDKDAGDDVPALWSLPAAGGDPRRLAAAPGALTGVVVANRAGTVVVGGSVLPGAAEGDAERRKARKDAGVSALLHEVTPVRHWDHDLGPDEIRLFVAEPAPASPDARPDGSNAPAHEGEDTPSKLRDLTPSAARSLEEAGVAISADGAFVVASWWRRGGRGKEARSIVRIDVATGEQRILATTEDASREPSYWYDHPAISPDNRFVVCIQETEATYDRTPQLTLWLIELATGAGRDLLPAFPYWPVDPVFSVDSKAVFFVADENGRCPVFRVDLDTGEVVRLAGDAAFGSVNVAADGRHLFALRAGIDHPLTPVRLDVDAVDQQATVLRGPGRPLDVPGRVEEVETTAPDGARVRGWLVLPDGASADNPAPLALWVHGGPLMSWNAWSWRWNPWLFAARGWAVLLPDPGLSQGYGDDFIQRAWGSWGPVPFADLMAITDATVARADVDETRTAAMGGSYGGYMANWIAGHTERFKAIVTHASLWTMEHFSGTTDHPWAWEHEWGHPLERPERFALNSPHLHLASVRTPMLVVHGDRDYRVPIGEGLRLFSDLVRSGVDAKFLYFPDENHWVLKPGNAKVWYQTVLAFLDHHVLGEPWVRPELV